MVGGQTRVRVSAIVVYHELIIMDIPHTLLDQGLKGIPKGKYLRVWSTLQSRDYEVKERVPVPHDNYFQSFLVRAMLFWEIIIRHWV